VTFLHSQSKFSSSTASATVLASSFSEWCNNFYFIIIILLFSPLCFLARYLGILVELEKSIGVDINTLSNAFSDMQDCFEDKLPYTREEVTLLKSLASHESCETFFSSFLFLFFQRDMYERSLVDLDKFLYSHLLRYRDCYPFAKPAGSIELSIEMIQDMYDDPLYLKK